MKIRFALPVTATDGMFGDVGDIVIDPITRDITHIVVEPHHRHCRARLVPIDVVTVDERGVSIALSTAQIRALPTVADGDFVRFGEPIDLGDDWDVGIEHVVSMPYSARPLGIGPQAEAPIEDGVALDFDRIPKGECEIRRESHVVTSDDHTVGLVDGFVADDTHIEGVIVQTGLPGFRHLVLIPVGSVERVSNDHIAISLTKHVFHQLPPVDDLDGMHATSTRLERLEHASASAVKRARKWVQGVTHRGSNG